MTRRRLLKTLCLISLTAMACSDDSTGASNSTTDSNSSNRVSNASADAGETTSMMTSNDAGEDNTTDADEMTAPRFSIEGELVACEINTSFEGQSSILAGGKNNPTGRGEQAGTFDPCNDRVILFAGNDRQPEECNSFGDKNYLGDTWAYAIEYENWYRINTDTTPPPRGRHAGAFDLSRKQMIIFGGRYRADASSGNYTLYNDTWSFDVNTDTWTELQTSGDIPQARTNSAMVYDAKRDRMILFGGNRSSDGTAFSPLFDTYTLDLNSNTWARVDSNGPDARLFHAMVIDTSNDMMLLYSGGDENAFFGDFLNDVWGLHLGDMSWEKLWDDASSSPNAPFPRINASLIDDPARGRVVMFGGHDDRRLGNTNELWAFDAAAREWTSLRQGDIFTGSSCSSFCQCPENFVEYDKASPERRQYQTMVRIGDTAMMFGGTGDCGYMDDTWTLDLDTATWTEVHAAEQGIACARTGREICEELCF